MDVDRIDPHHLRRFVEAQAAVYTQARDELAAGRKRSHWMWFVFPQLAGLGRSDTARHYALSSLDDDIRDHIERETRDNVERGMTPEEARRQAILKFGNVTLVKEDTRAIWGWQRVEQLAQDAWYALRILRRRSAYALLAAKVRAG